MKTLIPTPKLITSATGLLRLAGRGAINFRAYGHGGRSASAWLANRMERDFSAITCQTRGDRQGTIHVGPLHDLPVSGLAEETWRSSRPFETRPGQEQGYVLEVSDHSTVAAAMNPHGLQHGAATLLQLLRYAEGDLVMPRCRIEDWSNFRIRVGADWLLNAEINRWGYERGDGREALLARLKRKLDLAALYKINVVWFDGIGWSIDRAPGYTDLASSLADHAARHNSKLPASSAFLRPRPGGPRQP